MKLFLAVVLILTSIGVLEGARGGISITPFSVGETPVTIFARAGADGPPVIVAHGFAGSSQMIQGYALPLAQAGYRVFAFDFLGHGLQLSLLVAWRVPLGSFSPVAFLFVLMGCVVFGSALDRYAANFLPTMGRLWIIAVMAVGSILFFLADARLAHHLSFVRRLVLHSTFVASLFLAVALDFERLFFLLMIAPVIVLFYMAFGTIGHAVSSRSGPLAPGIALGLVLAWSLGVSFPLFEE